MWAKILIRLLVLLILPISVSAAPGGLNQLDSIRLYRVATYTALGLDTTGTSFLPVNVVTKFILRGVDQLPAWVLGREVTKVIATVDGTEQYYLDSLASQVVSVRRITNKSWNVLKQLEPGIFGDVFDIDSVGDEDAYKPLGYHFWGDSLWIYPVPRKLDSLRVAYYQEPTVSSDTVIVVKDVYQYGIVMWAVWQAIKRDLGAHSPEAVGAKTDYYEWVKQMQSAIITRPRDRLKNEIP